MKVITILGVRPQFIKAGSVSREIFRQKHFGADKTKILEAFKNNSTFKSANTSLDLYGGGQASESIVNELLNGC